jgi:hypothetical protein
MFARSGAVWSIDHWLARRRRPDDPALQAPRIPVWPIRLMQIQLGLVYLFTGLIKLGDGIFTPQWADCDWINGEALYWLYNDIELNRWPYAWTPIPLWLCRPITWSVMLFELGFVFLVPFRRTRPWVLFFGVLLHLGILLHTEIAFFSQFMLCWYVLFLSGDQVVGIVAWLGRVVGKPFARRGACGNGEKKKSLSTVGKPPTASLHQIGAPRLEANDGDPGRCR